MLCTKHQHVLQILRTVTLVGLIVALLSSRALATPYTFASIIFDPDQNYPAINNSGIVAFSESFTTYTIDHGVLTPISVGFVSTSMTQAPTINDAGQVVFIGEEVGVDVGVFNVYRGDGGTPVEIAAGKVQFADAIFNAVSGIADDGTVAFANIGNEANIGGPTGSGIYTGSGGSITTLVSQSQDLSFPPAFGLVASSHSGDIAYSWNGIHEIQNGVQHSLNAVPLTIESLAVNNSGTIALSGALSFTDAGLYLSNGTDLTKVVTVTSTVPYEAIGNASINNLGHYAFEGTTITANGIFTGPNPQTDKVIATGDALGGSTVVALAFGTDALNDRGQLTFWAQLANGQGGVYVATPVPEPSSFILVTLGLVTVLFAWIRRLMVAIRVERPSRIRETV